MTTWKMLGIMAQLLGWWIVFCFGVFGVYLMVRQVRAYQRDECLACEGRGFSARWDHNRAPRKCRVCQGTCEYRFPRAFGALWW